MLYNFFPMPNQMHVNALDLNLNAMEPRKAVLNLSHGNFMHKEVCIVRWSVDCSPITCFAIDALHVRIAKP